jgi:hypothetical protein
MTKEQELKNLIIKAEYQQKKWGGGKWSLTVGKEIFAALKLKVKEQGK